MKQPSVNIKKIACCTKGQLISKYPFGVFKSTKNQQNSLKEVESK